MDGCCILRRACAAAAAAAAVLLLLRVCSPKTEDDAYPAATRESIGRKQTEKTIEIFIHVLKILGKSVLICSLAHGLRVPPLLPCRASACNLARRVPDSEGFRLPPHASVPLPLLPVARRRCACSLANLPAPPLSTTYTRAQTRARTHARRRCNGRAGVPPPRRPSSRP